MRFSFVGLLAGLLLAVSYPAIAQPTVELLWRSTTGNGTPGTDTITAKAGDVLVLDVLVHDFTGGVTGAHLSLAWGAGITGYDALECPAPPNAVAGLCEDSGGLVFQPLYPGVPTTVGAAGPFDVISTETAPPPLPPGLPLAGFYGEKMTLGAITYVVDFNSAVTIEVQYEEPPLGGLVDDSYTFSAPPATAHVAPPCNGCGCP